MFIICSSRNTNQKFDDKQPQKQASKPNKQVADSSKKASPTSGTNKQSSANTNMNHNNKDFPNNKQNSNQRQSQNQQQSSTNSNNMNNNKKNTKNNNQKQQSPSEMKNNVNTKNNQNTNHDNNVEKQTQQQKQNKPTPPPSHKASPPSSVSSTRNSGQSHSKQPKPRRPSYTNLTLEAKKKRIVQEVKDLFKHGFDNYLTFAFPHDELKPLSHNYTDSLIELGNLDMRHISRSYKGIGLTLIDSLSSLVVFGEIEQFRWAVRWISQNVNFDIDARVNVFETNIRILGGLLSAHMFATNPDIIESGDYNNELLHLAFDLGQRLLVAFEKSPTALPYAWVNLKHGVIDNETYEQCTAGIATLVLEFELLSKLTGDLRFSNSIKKAVDVR